MIYFYIAKALQDWRGGGPSQLGVLSLSPKEYEWISVSFVGLPSSSTRPPSRPAHRWGGAGVQMPRLRYFTLYCSYVNEMGTVTRPGGSYLEGDDITQLQVLGVSDVIGVLRACI